MNYAMKEKDLNRIALFVKRSRRATAMTQRKFAIRRWPGLSLVHDFEREKENLWMEK